MAKDTTGRLHVTVKTGGKRKLSSKLWLERQLNDPYVAQAKRDGFRSRAAYKLQEIDDKHRILKRGQVVVDLVYLPVETPLLRAASAAGATEVDGIGMLVNQAALAVWRWTGVEPDVTAMERAARA